MSDQELLAYIDRKFGGQETEPDHIPNRGPDPHYAAALAQETAYDDEEEDEEQSEPAESLEDLANRATDAWAARPDEDDESDPGPVPESDADWQPALDAWAASLDDAARARIDAGGPEAAQASFMAFVERQAARERLESAASGDDATADSEGPDIRSGRDVTEYAYSQRAQLAEMGHTPESWLSWASSAPADEWRKAALKAGWDPALRPGYMDLTPKAQMSRVADDLARSAERTRARGGHW